MTKKSKTGPQSIFNFKWLYPGMKIKRWILLLILGILLITSGLAGLLITLRSSDSYSRYSLILLKVAYSLNVFAGIWLVIQAVKKTFRTIVSLFLPQREEEFIDIVYQKRQLARGPKIVVVGGGTGLSTIILGLKQHTVHISAIVTVADDGGSSGRLRDQFDILPPGDIRNCLVAMADAEPLMRKLFQFRFSKDSELAGHNFGNLFITAMTQLTGDFEQAIKESSKVLAIRGNVIPSTLRKVNLVAQYNDGTSTQGEAKIPLRGVPINKVSLNPGDCAATPEALSAIKDADIIILGPGSIFTSIIPNLLIKEITDAIVSSSALKAYVCNIMTQPGESDGFSASDHLKVLIDHSHPNIVNYCIVNNGSIPASLMEKYKEEGASYVSADVEKIRKMGYKVITDNLVTVKDVVRHNAHRLASIILKVFNSKKYAETR